METPLCKIPCLGRKDRFACGGAASLAVVLLAVTTACGQAQPWNTPDQLGGRTVPWQDMVTSPRPGPLSVQGFQAWLAPMSSKVSKVSPDPASKIARFTGAWKLRAPWPDNAVLRVVPAKGANVWLHFWAGKTGVSLLYGDKYQTPAAWTAYVTGRDNANSPRPSAYALAADDGGRFAAARSSGAAPITDVTYHGGKMVLSCGAVRLLAVPLAARPETVYVEPWGKGAKASAGLRVLAMALADKPPAMILSAMKNVVDVRPHGQAWRSAGGKAPASAGEGSVWLGPPGAGAIHSATVPVATGGVREFVFDIGRAQAGSGVFVGDAEGKEIAALRFSATPGNRTVVRLAATNHPVRPYQHNAKASPTPWVRGRVRLRMLLVGGTVRAWIGLEAGYWAEIQPGHIPAGAKPAASVGVYCAGPPAKTAGQRGIVLRRILVREYAAVSELAGESLVSAAPDLSSTDTAQWLAKALAARRGNTATDQWLRACAVRSLSAGGQPTLAGPLIRALAADVPASKLTVDKKLAALVQLAAISPPKSPGAAATWDALTRAFQRVGGQALDADGGAAFGSISAAASLMVPPPGKSIAAATQPLARRAVLAAALAGQSEQYQRIRRTIRAGNRSGPLAGILQWTQAYARQEAPSAGGFQHAMGLVDTREERAFKQDFRVVIRDRQWDRACKMLISRYVDTNNLGLVRNPTDPRGWVSLETSAAVLMQRYRRVQQVMIDDYTMRGRLRVRQAIADKSPQRVAWAAAQFYGTPAAAEAHVYLGDRAYTAGRYFQATQHYTRAVQWSDVVARGPARTRLRLAAAHLGKREGQPATRPVTIGPRTLTPQQIEQAVARGLQAAARRPNLQSAVQWMRLSPPMNFTARIVPDAGQMPPRPAQVPALLWTPQSAGHLMRLSPHSLPNRGAYLCRRVGNELHCTGPGNGNWQVKVPPLKNKVYRRRRGSKYTAPAPFNEQPPRPHAIGQPIIDDTRAYALFERQTNEQGAAEIVLCAYELAGGKQVYKQFLMTMDQFSGGKLDVQMAIINGYCLLAVKQAVICFRIGVGAEWARFPAAVSLREQAPGGASNASGRLVINAESLYYAAPGMPFVECVNIADGTARWTSAPMDVVGVMALTGEILIVQTADGVAALNASDGKTLWRQQIQAMPTAVTAGAGGVLCIGHKRAGGKAVATQLEATWLDSKTGRVRAIGRVTNPFGAAAVTAFGPMLGVGNEVLAYAHSGNNRQVVRLIPAGAAVPVNPSGGNKPLASWRKHLPPAR